MPSDPDIKLHYLRPKLNIMSKPWPVIGQFLLKQTSHWLKRKSFSSYDVDPELTNNLLFRNAHQVHVSNTQVNLRFLGLPMCNSRYNSVTFTGVIVYCW